MGIVTGSAASQGRFVNDSLPPITANITVASEAENRLFFEEIIAVF